MVAKRFGFAVMVAVTILAMAPLVSAQGLNFFGPNTGATCGAACDPCGQGFWMGLGVRQYFSSFTSVEYPVNLAMPGAQGKTRLEWPLDQLYGAVKLGYNRGAIGIVLDYMAPFGSGSGIKAQETFWDTDGDVNLFGKGSGHPRGSVFDFGITYALPVGASACEEPAFGLAAVAGFRQQNFRYTMTDLDESTTLGRLDARYPGASEEFAQSHTHWYIGGIITKPLDLGSFMGGCYPPSYRFLLALQADYAYVKSDNSLADFVRAYVWSGGGYHNEWDNWHKTTGGCWHVNASVAMDAGQCLKIVFEGDFKRISTNGNQDLSYPIGTVAYDYHSSSRVWSDQAYLGLLASYGF